MDQDDNTLRNAQARAHILIGRLFVALDNVTARELTSAIERHMRNVDVTTPTKTEIKQYVLDVEQSLHDVWISKDMTLAGKSMSPKTSAFIREQFDKILEKHPTIKQYLGNKYKRLTGDDMAKEENKPLRCQIELAWVLCRFFMMDSYDGQSVADIPYDRSYAAVDIKKGLEMLLSIVTLLSHVHIDKPITVGECGKDMSLCAEIGDKIIKSRNHLIDVLDKISTQVTAPTLKQELQLLLDDLKIRGEFLGAVDAFLTSQMQAMFPGILIDEAGWFRMARHLYNQATTKELAVGVLGMAAAVGGAAFMMQPQPVPEPAGPFPVAVPGSANPRDYSKYTAYTERPVDLRSGGQRRSDRRTAEAFELSQHAMVEYQHVDPLGDYVARSSKPGRRRRMSTAPSGSGPVAEARIVDYNIVAAQNKKAIAARVGVREKFSTIQKRVEMDNEEVFVATRDMLVSMLTSGEGPLKHIDVATRKAILTDLMSYLDRGMMSGHEQIKRDWEIGLGDVPGWREILTRMGGEMTPNTRADAFATGTRADLGAGAALTSLNEPRDQFENTSPSELGGIIEADLERQSRTAVTSQRPRRNDGVIGWGWA